MCWTCFEAVRRGGSLLTSPIAQQRLSTRAGPGLGPEVPPGRPPRPVHGGPVHHRASGIGHRASGIGHRASGIGHRASGIGHRALPHGSLDGSNPDGSKRRRAPIRCAVTTDAILRSIHLRPFNRLAPASRFPTHFSRPTVRPPSRNPQILSASRSQL